MKNSTLSMLLLLISLLPFSSLTAGAAETSKAKSGTITAKSTTSSRTIRSKTTKKKSTPVSSKAESVAEESVPAGKAKDVLIKATKAALRAKPVLGATSVRLLTQYTPVEIQSLAGSYAKVKTDDGASGYIHSSYLSDNAYVSTSNSSVKVRSGPGADDTALFALKEHYPLRVLEKSGDRVKVKDYEGDGGWVHENMLTLKNYVIANEKTINLREGPGVQFEKRFVADRGALFQVEEEKDGWLRLKYSDGDEGWCSAKIVWGWVTE